jgi:hypothetical protein
MEQQIKQQFSNKDNTQSDNNKENHKDKKLTFVDFLSPEFLIGALLRKAKMPSKASEFFKLIWVYLILLLVFGSIIIGKAGIEKGLEWFHMRLFEVMLTVILGFVVFRFIIKSWKK